MAESDPSADVHRHLLDIYIQEKDWEKAIGAAQEARGERQAQLPEGDRQLLLRARDHRADPRPRRGGARATSTARSRPTASACAPTCCAASGSRATAGTRRRSRRGRRIESQDPAYLGLAADGMVESYKALGRPGEGLTLLRGLQHRYPGLDLLNVVYQATAEQEGDEAAWRLVRDEVRRNPTLVGLDRLIDAELAARPARAPPGPAAHEEPRALARAGALRVPVRATAASRRASSSGNAPRAAAGRPSRRAAPPSSRPPAATSRGCRLDNKRVIVALDFPDAAAALAMAARLDPKLCRVKVGKELFVAAGPAVVERAAGARLRGVPRPQVPRHPQHRGGRLPRGGAAGRVDAERARERRRGDDARRARGGRRRRRARRCSSASPCSPASPTRTSARWASPGPLQENVERLARLARASGLDGVVCSAQEAPLHPRTRLGARLRARHAGHPACPATPRTTRRAS